MTATDLIEALLTECRFDDVDRARVNLDNLRSVLLHEQYATLLENLRAVLNFCPNPDRALNNLERFLGQSNADAVRSDVLTDAELFQTIVQLFGSSQFFSDMLIVQPRWIDQLQLPLHESPSREQMIEELGADVEAAHEESSVLKAFCEFRNRQMLRIGVNDLIRKRPLEEITRDISRVADASLEVALETGFAQVAKRFGEPADADGEPVQCVILAFGKHGGEELNYSSDIDLMFIYGEDGDTDGERIQSIDNAEFFSRVVTKVVRFLSTRTQHGQAYRVDLRLRPEGKRGPLARSIASTLSYYDNLGRTWERQALIKLRPAAGDRQLGKRFLAQVAPFIWRKYLSFAEISEIKAIKRRIEHRTDTEGDGARDMKTGFGGIRDVEFTIQFLQLLNGGDLPALRQRNTLKAMEALTREGCLTDQEMQILNLTYRFLRRVEHRLQIMFDLQTHAVPADPDDLGCLALGLGYGGKTADGDARARAAAAFTHDLEQKTELNRRILDHVLHEAFTDSPEAAAPETDLILDPDPDPETIKSVLERYRFKEVQTAYQNLVELSRESVLFLSTRRCRHFLASIAPQLLQAVAETPDPDMALVNLEKVSASLGGKGVLWELFSFSEPALKLYVDLCAWSQFLSEILVNNPGMIDDLLDSLILNQPRDRTELYEELRELCRGAEDTDMILHSFQDKELLRVGVRDILGKDSLKDTTAALSDLAEVILGQISQLQTPDLRDRYGVPYLGDGPRQDIEARYVILGLGKLGGREMSYHSDLDLIIIYEGDGRTGPPRDASRFDEYEEIGLLHYFTELSQRIIKAASLLGPRGRLYHVDMRLRPTGKSGSLVISLAEFQRYYASSQAQLWERQALTRARIVHGDADFGREVMSAVGDAIYSTPWQPEMAKEIAHMRERVQASGGRRDLKRGYGGIIDVEFLVQLFRLKYGGEVDALRSTNTWDALVACRDAELLSEEEHQSLWSSYVFLRLAESRLRIVYNRSLDELPDRDDDLDKLARRLGFDADADHRPGQRFLEELDQCLEQTRAMFNRLVEREETEQPRKKEKGKRKE